MAAMMAETAQMLVEKTVVKRADMSVDKKVEMKVLS
jgi:hypothetical protein